MSVTNPIDSQTLGALNGAAGAAANDNAAGLQDSFMTLLVTQLKNQDPMNPMKNAQMTSQLAQINTVTGINELNTTLESITGQIDTGQTLRAAELIGQGVLVPGERLLVGEESATTPLGFELEAPADRVRVTISDGSGQVVRQLELESLSEGVHSYAWDGVMDNGESAPQGAYRVSVEASSGGEAQESTVLNYAVVNGVSAGSDGRPRLDLGGVSEPVGLEDIRQIL